MEECYQIEYYETVLIYKSQSTHLHCSACFNKMRVIWSKPNVYSKTKYLFEIGDMVGKETA